MSIIHSIIQIVFDVSPYLGFMAIWLFFMACAYIVLTMAEQVSWWILGY